MGLQNSPEETAGISHATDNEFTSKQAGQLSAIAPQISQTRKQVTSQKQQASKHDEQSANGKTSPHQRG